MTVESAARWMKNTYDPAFLDPDFYPNNTSNYFGSVYLTARESGFYQPSRKWAFKGGTLEGAAVNQAIQADSPLLNLLPTYEFDSLLSINKKHPEGVNLGGSLVLGPGTKQSSIDLAVKETNPVTGPKLDAGIYKINWHAPFEKKIDLPKFHYNTPTSTPPVAVDRFGETAIPPIAPTTVSLSTGFEGIGGAIGALGGPEGYVAAASIGQALAGLFNLDVQIGGAPGRNYSNNSVDWLKVADDPNLIGNVSHPAWLQDRESGFTHFDVVMKEVRRWDRFRWGCDEFGLHGFVGPDRVLFAEKNVVVEYQPFYKLRPDEPATPSGIGGN